MLVVCRQREILSCSKSQSLTRAADKRTWGLGNRTSAVHAKFAKHPPAAAASAAATHERLISRAAAATAVAVFDSSLNLPMK